MASPLTSNQQSDTDTCYNMAKLKHADIRLHAAGMDLHMQDFPAAMSKLRKCHADFEYLIGTIMHGRPGLKDVNAMLFRLLGEGDDLVNHLSDIGTKIQQLRALASYLLGEDDDTDPRVATLLQTYIHKRFKTLKNDHSWVDRSSERIIVRILGLSSALLGHLLRFGGTCVRHSPTLQATHEDQDLEDPTAKRRRTSVNEMDNELDSHQRFIDAELVDIQAIKQAMLEHLHAANTHWLSGKCTAAMVAAYEVYVCLARTPPRPGAYSEVTSQLDMFSDELFEASRGPKGTNPRKYSGKTQAEWVEDAIGRM